jgi:major membrane immunogen (membrane-anchored lipoprotein)
MKNILLTLLIISASLMGCKKDKPETAELIVGTWELVSGSSKFYDANGTKVSEYTEDNGTISFDGTKATITNDGQYEPEEYSIARHGDHERIIFHVDGGNWYKINYINKSEMELSNEDDESYEANIGGKDIMIVKTTRVLKFRKR